MTVLCCMCRGKEGYRAERWGSLEVIETMGRKKHSSHKKELSLPLLPYPQSIASKSVKRLAYVQWTYSTPNPHSGFGTRGPYDIRPPGDYIALCA